MVQPEQPVQPFGVLLAAFHLVEHLELAMHQPLVPVRDAEEDLVDAFLRLVLLHRGGDRGVVGGVECLRHLPDLVVAVVQRDELGFDVDALAALEPGHDVGQSPAGELQRVVAQFRQPGDQGPVDQPPGVARGQGDADQHGRQRRQAAREHLDEPGIPVPHAEFGAGLGLRHRDRHQFLGNLVGGLPPRRAVDGELPAALPRMFDERVLEADQPPPIRAGGELPVEFDGARLGGRYAGGQLGVVGADQKYEGQVVLGAELPAGQRGAAQ